ncbi:restriction endonuclease subunit S, partial [Patescibacteria group bacterium]|nr:restriction endonuclease subunit S [Patescibacteria group bacterium]
MKTNQLQKNISTGWQSKTLGDFLSKLEGGGTPSKDNSDYWNGSIPWSSVKDVVTHNPDDTQDHISELGLKNSSSRLVSKGTLIVPTRMALGHAVVFNVDVAINQDLKALYPKKDLLNKYLFYWFLFKKEFIERLGSGSTVSGIQQNELKRIKFNLPSLPEQNRIVSVLETWDKNIEKLNKKIEIKKQIKKGLMQDLLTGKKRLTGFKNKWEIVKFGNLIINQEKTGRASGASLDEGKYPFFNNSSKGFDQYLNEFDFDGEMLIANTGGAAYFDYYFGKFATMSDNFVFSTKQNCKFLFYN